MVREAGTPPLLKLVRCWRRVCIGGSITGNAFAISMPGAGQKRKGGGSPRAPEHGAPPVGYWG
jgi:hypothetical protein